MLQDRTSLRLDALRASYLLGDTPKPQHQKLKSRAESTANQELVAFKKLRFSQWLSVSKSCGALALITRTAPETVPITPLNISLQGMWGCAVSPRKSKAGWTVTMVIHRSHSTLEAPDSPLASRLRSFDMVGRLFGQACQMAQQRTQ